eukprot:3174767-Alexandrium_andersonii.AAC.1
MKATSSKDLVTTGRPHTSVPCSGAGGCWLAGPWSAGRPSMGACSPAAGACSAGALVVMLTMVL